MSTMPALRRLRQEDQEPREGRREEEGAPNAECSLAPRNKVIIHTNSLRV
jgi:hypothetical protein